MVAQTRPSLRSVWWIRIVIPMRSCWNLEAEEDEASPTGVDGGWGGGRHGGGAWRGWWWWCRRGARARASPLLYAMTATCMARGGDGERRQSARVMSDVVGIGSASGLGAAENDGHAYAPAAAAGCPPDERRRCGDAGARARFLCSGERACLLLLCLLVCVVRRLFVWRGWGWVRGSCASTAHSVLLLLCGALHAQTRAATACALLPPLRRRSRQPPPARTTTTTNARTYNTKALCAAAATRAHAPGGLEGRVERAAAVGAHQPVARDGLELAAVAGQRRVDRLLLARLSETVEQVRGVAAEVGLVKGDGGWGARGG